MRLLKLGLVTALTCAAATVIIPTIAPPTVSAASDITLTVSSPGDVIADSPTLIPVTLTTDNPVGGDGLPGFNVTFSVIVPIDVVPSGSPPPTEILIDGTNQILVYQNMGDVQDGSSFSLEIVLEAPAAGYPVGSEVDIDANVFVNTNPRTVPKVSGDGTSASDSTSTADSSTTTDVTAIDIQKASPDMNFGDEALRGVHDHVVEFVIDVYNTNQGTTGPSLVDDFIPSSMEFLGCGGVDNTTDSPSNPGSALEYPTAPALTATALPAGTCPTPVLVESVDVVGGVIFSGTATNGTAAPVDVPDGVYTHVVWDVGTLAAAGTAVPATSISYQAGIPLLENVYDPLLFSDATGGGAPVLGASGDPTANLDNNGLQAPDDNTPFYTNETGAEQQPANYASVAGTYAGPVEDDPSDRPQADSFVLPYSIEDLAIAKGVDLPDPLLQGEVIDYTLTIRTSEYREVTNMTVTDPISDGQCILLGGPDPEVVAGNAPFSGECAIASPAPSSALESLVENADGSWLMTWDFTSDPGLVSIGASGEHVITFSTLLRESYQENFDDDAPTNGSDPFANSVDIDGTSNLITGIPDNPTFDAETIYDDASVSFGVATASIDKSISLPAAPGDPLDCNAATWVRTDPDGAASPAAPAALQAPVYAYRTGDRVCYRLGVDFSADLNYRNPVVNDFLPPGFEFEQFWGADVTTGATGSNTVVIDGVPTITPSVDGDIIDWLLGATDPDTVGGPFENDLFVSNGGERFEVVFSALVVRPAEDLATFDLMSNLMKFNTANILGDTVSLRDSADSEHVQPNVGIAKDTPTAVAVQGETIDYTVTVTNNFPNTNRAGVPLGAPELTRAEARAVSNWDVLPVGIICVDITTAPTLDVPGTITPCADGVGPDGRSVIAFTIDSLLPQQSGELSYSITLPAGISAGQELTNNAGVREYTGTPGNDGDPTNELTFVPQSNIDPTQDPSANMPAALASDTVTTPPATIGKNQQSQFEDLINPATNVQNTPPSRDLDEATIGEQILYQVVDIVVPEAVTIYNAEVTDALPAGTSVVSLNGATRDTGDGFADDALAEGFTLAESGGVVTLTFPTPYDNPASSGNDTIAFAFTVVVDDTLPDNVAGTELRNAARFAWETVGGEELEAFSDDPADPDDDLITRIVEPNPVIVKTNNAPTPAPTGTPITFTHTITNPDVGGNTSNVYDVVVTDVLPDGLNLVTNPNGGTVSPDGRTIVWNSTTTPSLAAIEPNATVTITYTAQIEPPAVAAETLTNEVDLVGSSLPGTVTGERTYTNDSDSDVVPPAASLVKDVQPLGDLATDDDEFTLGQPIDYDLTVQLPQGVVAYDATAFDQLPAGLTYDSFGTPVVSAECIVFDPVTQTPTGAALAAADIALLAPPVGGDAQRLAAFFGDLAAVGGDCTITIPYTVHVTDTASGDLTNAATLVWNSADVITDAPEDLIALPVDYDDPAGDWDQATTPVSETVTVVEPQLELDQDVTAADGSVLSAPTCDNTPGNDTGASDDDDGAPTNGCDVEAGAEVLKTITITNTGTSNAYDTTVVENVPVGVTPLVALGGLPATDGATITGPSLSTGIWDEGTRTITWILPAAIVPGIPVTLDFAAQLDDSDDLADEQDFTFDIDIPEYFGIPEAERDQIVLDNALNGDIATYGAVSGENPADPDSATIEVHFPELDITKDEVAPSDATDALLDEAYAWRITVTNTDTVATAFDVDVTDTLPAFATLPGAWTYVAGSAVVTSPNIAGLVTNPTGAPNGPLVWTDLDDLAPGQTIVIELQIVPNSAILAPDKATGSTNLGSTVVYTNDVATVGDDASGSSIYDGGTEIGDTTTDDVVIRSTDLSVDKSVSAGPYTFGADVDWTITLNNAGPDAATNVTLADVLPVGLVYVSTVSSTQGAYDSGTGVWTVGTVASGATHTIVIRTRINQIGSITNRAEVKTNDQWDVDSTPSDQAAVADEDDDDTVTIVAGAVSLGDYVWYDIDGNSSVDTGEPGIPNVRLVLQSAGLDNTFGTADDFFGPDGVAGGGDDIVVTEAFTSGTGFYGFSALPIGRYRVQVDTSTLPPGMTATFNDDAPNTTDPDLDDESGIITLTPSGYLDADFGYTGTGSLGDTVWLDKDASGGATLQPGEPGMPGIDVTLEWGGPDADLSTPADNVTYPIDTTDGFGQYGFDLLPGGPYRVTLDPADLPAGLTATYDLDFGTVGTPGTTDTSLTAGQNRTDVDFSYAGTGSIGDRIWYDLNGDGFDDVGEPGLGGIDVTVTWVAGNGGADVVFTTVTDADGNYLVDHLPEGNYTVTIDDTDLPPGMLPTYDLDGTGTAHTVSTTLTSGQDRDDADFGYTGVASVGDQVWFDIDGDGAAAPQPGDPALPNLPVSIRWAGSDGTLDTTDDVVIPTVTDSTGTYLVTNLPYGSVRVSIDPADLPGFAATFDGNGIGTLDQVTVILDVDDAGTVGIDEANPRTADFAYTGTGSIGDLVWEDTNANGVLDGAEQGLDAVGLTVTWAGLDGIDGTSDDVVFTTTTNPAGAYVVDRLPAGGYTVVVDTSTVAPGLVSVSELDAALDSSTTITLTPGQDRTDVDFGYQPQADLSIDKSHTDYFEIGENAAYTIVVTNLGPASAVTPTVTDVLPTGLTYVDGTGTGTSCSAVGQTVTCELVTMAVNDTIAIQLTVAIEAAAAPAVVNTASVVSSTRDLDLTNNSDDDPTDVPLADLSIDKSHSDLFEIGENAAYTIVVTNLGPSPAVTPTVTDVLPTGLTYVDGTGTGTSCSAVGQTVTCELVTMAVNDTIAIQLTVAIAAAAAPAVVNTASVVSSTQDPDLTNNSDDDPTELPVADLSLSKRLIGPLVMGSTGEYEIVATNLGPSPSGGELVITDVLPDGLAFVAASGDRLTCSASGQSVTCRTDGSVAVDEVITATIQVRVTGTGGQQIINTASVVATSTPFSPPAAVDPAIGNNDDVATSTITTRTIPTTGADSIQDWIQAALWAIALGAFGLIVARRRRYA